jgi:hypothetical protein
MINRLNVSKQLVLNYTYFKNTSNFHTKSFTFRELNFIIKVDMFCTKQAAQINEKGIHYE